MKVDDRKKLYTYLMKKEDSQTIFEKYIKGLPLTIEYAELSPYKIPLRGNSVAFRIYEDNKKYEIFDRIKKDLGLCL